MNDAWQGQVTRSAPPMLAKQEPVLTAPVEHVVRPRRAMED
jgi:hypothetical protein